MPPAQLMVDEISICDIRAASQCMAEDKFQSYHKATTDRRLSRLFVSSSYFVMRAIIYRVSTQAAKQNSRRGLARGTSFHTRLRGRSRVDRRNIQAPRLQVVSLYTLHFASVMNTQHLTVTLITLKNRTKCGTL